MQSEQWEEAQHELTWLLLQEKLTSGQGARAHRLGSKIALCLNQHYNAMLHCQQAALLAREAGDDRTLVEILIPTGVAHLWLGNVSDAVDAFRSFIDQMDRVGLQELAGKAWFNLGISFRLQHQWNLAIEAFKVAEGRFAALNAAGKQSLCQCEIAWCEARGGSPQAGQPWLEKAAGYLERVHDDYLEGQYLCARALQLALLGHRAESTQCCRNLLTSGGAPEVLGPACWVAGLNALAGGRLEEAGCWAELALEYAKHCPFGDIVEMAYDLYHHVRVSLGSIEGVL